MKKLVWNEELCEMVEVEVYDAMEELKKRQIEQVRNMPAIPVREVKIANPERKRPHIDITEIK